MRIASVSDARVPNVATVLLAKLLQGYAATFVRSEGEHFVVSVNGQERTISREAWRSLPDDTARAQRPAHQLVATGSVAEMPTVSSHRVVGRIETANGG
jgi:hypothetical protein